MALDPNLYTLDLVRREDDPALCDWVGLAFSSVSRARSLADIGS